jgi:hypothetical protein
MSSWISQGPSKRLVLGYRQAYPEGRFIQKTKPATVVSAYYETPSKHSVEQYKIWIRGFLESIPCYLVFFTEEPYKEFIEDCRRNYRDRTHIVVLNRAEWKAQQFGEGFWKKQFEMDDEKNIHRSTDLYKVWYEKKEFVKRAIELNPFNHTDFVWTDSGFFRSGSDYISLVKDNYPDANRIPTDKILMLNYWPFTLRDNVETHGIIGGGSGKPRIGGGIVAAHKDVWRKYDIIYDEIVVKYNKANLFIGKEQTIMASIVLNHKDLVSLLELKPICQEMWFYLGLWLGVNEKIYKLFMSDRTNQLKRTYKQLLDVSV